MRFLKMFLGVLVLTTFASAWGFEKGDTFSWDKQLAIQITDVKKGGIAISKFYAGDHDGWAVFIFEKVDEKVYLTTLLSLEGKSTMSPFYIKEIKEGVFIKSKKLEGGDIAPYKYLLEEGRITFLKI